MRRRVRKRNNGRNIKRVRKYLRRRRAIRSSRNVTVSRGVAPIAPRFIGKFKYVGEHNFASTSGVPGFQTYNLNSMFDPDYTGGGHQPYGYDQVKTLYDYYRVFAVSWRAEVVGVNAYDIPRLTILAADEASLPNTTNRTLMMEFPRAYTREGSHGNNKVTMRGRCTLHKLRGQTRAEYMGDESNRALISADPSHSVRLYCMLQAANDPTITCSATIKITLIYHTELFDTSLQQQS